MTLDSNEIMQVLPHRFPFQLVDRITECEPGVRAVGRKCVTVNEQFFCGHFPEKHVMPGVLILEALAQVGAQSVVVRPVRAAPGDTDVLVRTEVRGRGDPVQLDYRLEKTPGQGAGWKIYNLNVLGAWLVETYRSQFAAEINAKGIDGLIQTLSARNKGNAARG